MSIEQTYKEVLLEKLITEALDSGDTVDPDSIIDELEAIIADSDLSVPQFLADTYHVVPLERASANKFNNTFKDVRQDLVVLYREVLKLGDHSVKNFERWKAELFLLEKKLIDLEDVLDDLLLLSQDVTAKNFLIDNFTDDSFIDWDYSDITLDITKQLVHLGPTDETKFTRILLNDLQENKIVFKVKTSAKFVARTDATATTLANVFNQQSSTWWTTIDMSTPSPVVCELSVELGSEPVYLNRIDIDLHDSVQCGVINVTPLYSVDNYTFQQLPTESFSLDITNTASFIFTKVEARFIKFLLSKSGADPQSRPGVFSFQFGFKEIAFFNQEFVSGTNQTLVSEMLSVADSDGDRVPFSKLLLEVCERVPAGTTIDYFLGVTVDADDAVDDMLWFPVRPAGRASGEAPVTLDLNDISALSVGTDGEFKIAYDGLASADYVNPAQAFHLLSYNTVGEVYDDEVDAEDVRYVFNNPNDRILNYQIKDSTYTGSGSGDGLDINEEDMLLYRNTGEKGLGTEPTDKVRGVQRGWRFEEPYYVSVIEILNPAGVTIDFGNSPVIIDDQSYSNKVPATVLTGKTSDTTGRHIVKVHKDNWLPVEAGLNTLAALQLADSLYPYNHKLLIEGYDYGASYPSSSAKVYAGVDLFAAYLMRRTGIYDFVHNVPADGYQYFALDRDLPDTHTGGNDPTRVFLVKVDESRSDFQNETFVLRFNLIDQQYTYFRLKANFYSESEDVSPVLDAYKVKLG